MALTAATFKTKLPEFGSVPPADIDNFLAQALIQINTAAWGLKSDDGQLYLAAHLLSSFGITGTDNDIGVVTSKKVGDVSVSYSIGDAFSESGFGSTKYGRHYLTLQAQIFAARAM